MLAGRSWGAVCLLYRCSRCVHSLRNIMLCAHLRVSPFPRFGSNFSSPLSAPSTVGYITSRSPGSTVTGTQSTFPLLSAHVSAAPEVSFPSDTCADFVLFSSSSVAHSRARLSVFGVSVLLVLLLPSGARACAGTVLGCFCRKT